MRALLQRFLRNEDGATAIEYGLIAALVVIAMMGGLRALGGGAGGMWTKVKTEVESN